MEALRRDTKHLLRKYDLGSIGKIIAKIIIYRIPNKTRNKMVEEVISNLLCSQQFEKYWTDENSSAFLRKNLPLYKNINHVEYTFKNERLRPIAVAEALLSAFGTKYSGEILLHAVDSMIFLDQIGSLGGASKIERTWEQSVRFQSEMNVGELGISYCLTHCPEISNICLSDL